MANILPVSQAILGQASAWYARGAEELAQMDSELARLDVRDVARQLSKLREELALDALAF